MVAARSRSQRTNRGIFLPPIRLMDMVGSAGASLQPRAGGPSWTHLSLHSASQPSALCLARINGIHDAGDLRCSCPSLGRNRHQIARSNCRLIGALIGHPHRSVWVPIPADIIQTDSHFELVTQHHSGGVAALLGRFLLRLGPHKQSRGPFYDKGDPPCGSFTSGGFVHCSSTHSFNLTEIKGAILASRTVV